MKLGKVVVDSGCYYGQAATAVIWSSFGMSCDSFLATLAIPCSLPYPTARNWLFMWLLKKQWERKAWIFLLPHLYVPFLAHKHAHYLYLIFAQELKAYTSCCILLYFFTTILWCRLSWKITKWAAVAAHGVETGFLWCQSSTSATLVLAHLAAFFNCFLPWNLSI